MDIEAVKAMFHLAGLETRNIRSIENQYSPSCSGYEPWWLIEIPQGFIEMGWRKKVLHIDWRGTGLVFPLIGKDGKVSHNDTHLDHNANITKWETGIHAWSYGQAVNYLAAFKMAHARHLYLKKYWTEENPATPESLIEFAIPADINPWEIRPDIHKPPAELPKTIKKDIKTVIKGRNATEAIQNFYEKYPFYKVRWCHELEKLNNELSGLSSIPQYEPDV